MTYLRSVCMCKCWGSLDSRNASFNGSDTMGQRNSISPDTTKGGFLWINGYFRRNLIMVGI